MSKNRILLAVMATGDHGRVHISPPHEYINGCVAIVRIDNKPVNALSPSTLQSFSAAMEKLQSDSSVRAIVITGFTSPHSMGSFFSAGFDITSLRRQQAEGKPNDAVMNVNAVLNSLVEAGPKPVVAAVNGLALGGGCEVAMSCAARIAVPEAKLGLPELQLGIIPGFGGTQRLPRLIGLEKAIKAMLTSKPMSAFDAKKSGLVDEIVPLDTVILEAARVGLEISNGRRTRRYTLLLKDKLPSMDQTDQAVMMMDFARKQAIAKQPNLSHPSMCIDAVLEGVMKGSMYGLEKVR